MSTPTETIRACLDDALTPVYLEIIDDSMAHAGHVGAQQGGGHFSAVIVAEAFTGKSMVQRHQLVYRALGELMHSAIHAFSMKVYTPAEYQQQKKEATP